MLKTISGFERKAYNQISKVDKFITELEETKEKAETVKADATESITRLKMVNSRCDSTIKFVNNILNLKV